MRYIYEKARLAVRTLTMSDRPQHQRLTDAALVAHNVIFGIHADSAPEPIRSVLAELEARVAPLQYGERKSFETTIAAMTKDEVIETTDLFLRLLNLTAEAFGQQELRERLTK